MLEELDSLLDALMDIDDKYKPLDILVTQYYNKCVTKKKGG